MFKESINNKTMSKNKKELYRLSVDMTLDDKAIYEELMKAVESANGEHGFINSFYHSLVEESDAKDDDKEPEAFQPKEGDICTCVLNGNIDAIFRYDGKTRTDEDGNVWLDGDLELTWSGDLFHPYMVIHGEDAEYDRDCCRLATEEEIALYQSKVKEFEEAKNANGEWEPKKGCEYWVPNFIYIDGCFKPVLTTWSGCKIDIQMNSLGWMFVEKFECRCLCDRLNEAIKNVKP